MTSAGLELITDTKLRNSLEQAYARDALARLSDETVIPSDLAALYLGVSLSTLRRIVGNDGPKPTKNPESSSTAFNQKALFEMGELRRWRQKNKAGGVAEQALLRGLGFQTLSDLAIEQPFWLRQERRSTSIIGHGLTLPAEVVNSLLDDFRISVGWLPWDEALRLPWESIDQRNLFAPLFDQCMLRTLGAVEAGREATSILLNKEASITMKVE